MKKLLLLSFALIITVWVDAQPVSKIYKQITVAQDGSGDFKTIQEAINAVRDLSQQQVSIYIKKGVYHEKLVIPSWKTHISLIGEDKAQTIITNADYAGKLIPNGGTDASSHNKINTYTSYTVLAAADNFRAENLTISNTSGRVGQAVALHIEGDRCVVKNCNLLGNQDTLYTGTGSSREYFKGCYIEGTTDFIFGEATAVFQDCIIKNLTNSFITAAGTTANQPYGYVFMNCRLVADSSVKKAYLGRPWRPYAKTVYIRTQMGSHIAAEGWNPWKGDAMFPDKEKTAFYAEYKSTGPGANIQGRAAWSKQLSAAEAGKYTIKNILGGQDNWNPEK